MATVSQIDANRANARKSTGPRSDTGKARSSQNSTTHGLYSKRHIVLASEDQSAFDALLETLRAEFLPRTPFERHQVDLMAQARWRQLRIERFETAVLDDAGDFPDPDLLLKYDRLRTSAGRAYDKAFQSLLTLRKIRQHTPLFLVPNEKVEETNPIPQRDFEAEQRVYRPVPEPPPGPVNPDRPRQIPYDLGMELKKLKRFYPNFDPRRSRKHLSPELRAFLKDPKNLELVIGAMVNL